MNKGLKELIVIAHGFPGVGGRGVGLLNQLAARGFRLWVVTNADPRRASQEEVTLKSLHPSITVISAFAINRSPFRVFTKLFGWQAARRFCERFFFVPDLFVIWAVSAYLVCRKLKRDREICAVITISPPESSHLVGLWLRRYDDIKWVANFEDLWSGKTHVFRPATRLHSSMIKRLERLIYEHCDLLIANTRGNRDRYVKDFGIGPEKIAVVTLGYDENESRDALSHAQNAPEGTFSLGYMGSFDKEGFPYRESIALLKRLREENPNTIVRFEVCGEISKKCLKEIDESGMACNVNYHGLLPHAEAVKRMAGCDALLVLLYETEYSAAIVPHKLYHYLGLRKPIIALAPESGEVASILSETRAGNVFSISRLDAAYGWLQHALKEKQTHQKVSSASDLEAVAQYEFSKLASKLAIGIDGCLGG